MPDPSSPSSLIPFAVAAGRETYFGDGTASGVVTFTTKNPDGTIFGLKRVTVTATYKLNGDGSLSERRTPGGSRYDSPRLLKMRERFLCDPVS